MGESSSAAITMNNIPSVNQLKDMLHDAMGPDFFSNENSATVVEDAVQFGCVFEDVSGGGDSIFEEPRGHAKNSLISCKHLRHLFFMGVMMVSLF
ncbi:hypothetical protein SLA2020_051360 [Shorea laevis]